MTPIIKIDNGLLYDVRQRLEDYPNKMPQAISNAMNRTVSSVVTNISKEVRGGYILKASEIKEMLKKTKANRMKLSAMVKRRGELLPLDRFKVSPRRVSPKRKSQIKMAVKKGWKRNVRTASGTRN